MTHVTTLGVVDVSMRNGRPIEPHFVNRRLGGQALLPWLLRRVSDAQRIDLVVAVMSELDAGQIAESIPSDIPVITCESTNAVERLVAAADAYNASALVRITVDCPFVDPSLIDALIFAADNDDECDFITYVQTNGIPAALTTGGLYAEWYRADALRRACKLAGKGTSQESADFFSSQPNVFKSRLLAVPARLQKNNLRLRLDEPEDWEHAEAIIGALGDDELDWQGIAEFVHDSSLQRRMDQLNRMPTS